jgi:hypothetical protein
MISLVVMLSAWALWHDLGVYRAPELKRLGGPTYQVTAHETKAECEAEQRAAMAYEERSRSGPMTERLSDGIKVWDPDGRHYTTLRYICLPTGADPTPFR